MTEYEFTLPDGSKRYEMCDGASDVHAFTRMHKATRAAPVKVSRDASLWVLEIRRSARSEVCAWYFDSFAEYQRANNAARKAGAEIVSSRDDFISDAGEFARWLREPLQENEA